MKKKKMTLKEIQETLFETNPKLAYSKFSRGRLIYGGFIHDMEIMVFVMHDNDFDGVEYSQVEHFHYLHSHANLSVEIMRDGEKFSFIILKKTGRGAESIEFGKTKIDEVVGLTFQGCVLFYWDAGNNSKEAFVCPQCKTCQENWLEALQCCWEDNRTSRSHFEVD